MTKIFSTSAPPSKLVYIGAKCAIRKILGSVAKNGYLKIVPRGGPLGRQGVESLRGDGGMTFFEKINLSALIGYLEMGPLNQQVLNQTQLNDEYFVFLAYF